MHPKLFVAIFKFTFVDFFCMQSASFICLNSKLKLKWLQACKWNRFKLIVCTRDWVCVSLQIHKHMVAKIWWIYSRNSTVQLMSNWMNVEPCKIHNSEKCLSAKNANKNFWIVLINKKKWPIIIWLMLSEWIAKRVNLTACKVGAQTADNNNRYSYC